MPARPSTPAPRPRAARLRRVPMHVVALALTAVWLTPVVGLLVSSFRPASAVATTGWWESFALPGDYTLQNYTDVLEHDGFGLSLFNSLAATVPATVLTVTVGAAAAHGLAFMRFRLRSSLLLLTVGLLIVPIQITLVPLLRLFNTLDLTGSFLGLWLVHLGFSLPFGIYLLHRFFVQLPRGLFEAAAIDGASSSQVFFRIVLPVSRPAIAALAVFEFVWNWNDLLAALIFLGGFQEVAPMTVAVSNLVASRGNGWEVLTAAAMLSMVVPMAVFLVMRRQFVHGLLAGATKG